MNERYFGDETHGTEPRFNEARMEQDNGNVDEIMFAEEEAAVVSEASEPWKILVVDDEDDVHAVTHLALKREIVEGKTLNILDAYSANQGRRMFEEHSDIALVLLDVVMETSSAGLDFVKYIRDSLHNRFVRIILRTGQPGYAPEHKVIAGYDINDYKTKSELTANKLFTVIHSGLRTYSAFKTIDEYRQGLEQKVRERTQALEAQKEELQAEVNKRKQTEKELRNLNQQLQEANASKNKFFSIIAHDLRSPFAGFLGITRIMADNIDGWEKAEVREITHQMKHVGENLYALLENLLTWSRIQQNSIEFYLQRLRVRSIITRNIDLLTPNAEQKQITLKNSVHDQLFVHADLNMVDTIVRNLLSNALKFTNAGGTIEISAVPKNETINVSIADTGIGISEKHLPKLFQIDTKYQRTGTAHEAGTGLGLVLCKEFVERNGGSIWVASEVGKGTTFTFALLKESFES